MGKKANGNVVSVEFLHDGRLAIRVAGVTHGPSELFFDPRHASVENQSRMRQLGAKNTIVDRAALERDKTTGLPATPDEKRDAMLRRIEWLANSENTNWAASAGPRDGQGDPAGLVFQALMRHFGDTDPGMTEARVAKVQAKRQLKDRAETLKALGREPAIIRIVADIKAERAAAAAKANAASMLDEMGDDEDDEAPMGITRMEDEGPKEDAGSPADNEAPF